MPYTKTIVCLANSWKKKGVCVAGIEWPANGSPNWVRPVSDREHEQLEWPDYSLPGGEAVALLDLVKISFIEHRPHACQKENHLIDTTRRWQRVGMIAAADLLRLTKAPSPLWIDGRSSGEGENDKIPEDQADALHSSLCLVRATDVTIRVIGKTTATGEKPQARVRFKIAASTYDLSVTDPVAHRDFVSLGRGEHPLDHSLALCISLSEPLYGYRYKLAAGVVHLPR